MFEGAHDEAASWLKKALAMSRTPGVPAAGRGPHDGLAGHQRPAPGRAGQLHRLRRPVELHLPDRPRGGPHPAVRLARGGRVVLHLPRRVARRPPRPMAAEHRRDDARRVSGQGPAAVPDPGRAVPLEARPGPVRERRDARRPRRAGPDLAGGCIFDDFTGDGRPDVFTTTFDVTHGASLYVNRGDGGVRGPLRQVRARRPGLCPERRSGRLRQRRPASTSCSSAGPGRSRPGCRC